MSAQPAPQLSVVAETAAGYQASGRLEALQDAMAGLLAAKPDELDEPSLRAELDVLEMVRRQVVNRIGRDTEALADRAARRARQANPSGGAIAQQRARRQTRNELADELGWSKGEAKDNERLGQALTRSPRLAEAADDGQIPTGNATLLSRFAQGLDDGDWERVKDRVAEAAATQDPVTFGRTLRKLEAELVPEDAEAAEARRHGQRNATVSTTPAGMTRIHADLATVDGALVARAIDTYRRMDRPDEHRQPGQRTADALADMARAALRLAGSDPDDRDGDDTTDERATPPDPRRPGRTHGTRPHVVVTVPIDVLLKGAGKVDVDGSPVPLGAIRHLMDDAGWSFVVTETNTKPVAVTGESRTVPAGLWRALVQRDGGCIVEGCDHKPDWCDVMHLTTPYREGGRLSLVNAALGCRSHHSAWDNTDRFELHWQDGRPILRRRGSPDARAGPAP